MGDLAALRSSLLARGRVVVAFSGGADDRAEQRDHRKTGGSPSPERPRAEHDEHGVREEEQRDGRSRSVLRGGEEEGCLDPIAEHGQESEPIPLSRRGDQRPAKRDEGDREQDRRDREPEREHGLDRHSAFEHAFADDDDDPELQ